MNEEYLKEKEILEDLMYKDEKVELICPTLETGGVDFLIVLQDLSPVMGKHDVKSEEIFGALTDKGMKSLINLINKTVENSFSEIWDKESEDLKRWSMQNIMLLMMEVIKLCMPQPKNHEDSKKEKILNHLNNKK